jgi:Arc/MetJ-type ribon-helix-helix transcriptional regulator
MPTGDYICVLVPPSLLGAIDKAIEKGGFQNRSEVTRAALREYLKAHGYLGGDSSE